MGLRDLLMSFGIAEAEADRLVAKGLPQYRANVAYHESRRDLAAMTGPEDFEPTGEEQP